MSCMKCTYKFTEIWKKGPSVFDTFYSLVFGSKILKVIENCKQTNF